MLRIILIITHTALNHQYNLGRGYSHPLLWKAEEAEAGREQSFVQGHTRESEQQGQTGVCDFSTRTHPWCKHRSLLYSHYLRPHPHPLLPGLGPWDGPRGHPSDPGKNSTPNSYF